MKLSTREYSPKQTLMATKAPAKQGFYAVLVAGMDYFQVAAWGLNKETKLKQWYTYVNKTPSEDKLPQPLEGVIAYAPVSKSIVEQALARELTEDEKIEKAYKSFCMHADIYPRFTRPIPERRQLKVGDAIHVGNLIDCKVVKLFEDGHVVAFQFHDRKDVYGKPVDNGQAYQCTFWYSAEKRQAIYRDEVEDVLPVRKVHVYNAYRNNSLDSLMHRYTQGLDDNPVYQREYVWTYEDKQRLLESVFLGKEIGRFVFIDNKYPKNDEILDGKQRLNTLVSFWLGELDYKGIYWTELSPRTRDMFENTSVQFMNIPANQITPKDILELFLDLNAAGVPQSEEHLQKVKRLLEAEA